MIRVFKHYVSPAVLVLGAIDALLLLICGEAGWRLRAAQAGIDLGPFDDRLGSLVIYAVVAITALMAVGLYRAEALRSPRFALARLLVGLSFTVIAIAAVGFWLPGATFWRSTLMSALFLSGLSMLILRLIVDRIDVAGFQRRVVVLGAGSRAVRMHAMSQRPESRCRIVAFVSMTDNPTIASATPREDITDLADYVDDLDAGEVVLALEERRNSLPLDDLLRIKMAGVRVNDFSSFVERETGRVDLDTVNPSWLIFSDGFSSGRAVSIVVRRAFDIIVSGLALLVTAPVILLFALLVKLDSSGPAFFRQTRVGHFGVEFGLMKLRSMRTDAEKDGAQFAQERDPRITRIGRFIRLTRIDELPQCWNVLKGDMSFVGPRPERPEFVAELAEKLPFYSERHIVKPGITGWAQINYPYGASLDDSRHKLEYDLYYAKNYSLFLDLLILLQTLRVVLWNEGAR
ncbi:TIGR03013 family XrtA/PEP-CTERM system glycosyltransferase [Pseudoblastomonas halimionae]|uniref:TIGR03013 family PEP-CTERM/XrtA system glycosyltransferase n=1 Tax=Alteriqipengyuania halimionae TaxID=1926630 RepID=A0A6I4U382_9SPHN|nr:TIGR03013 family XrtA/PEP-CTERM system glycosyltransferase [Alteriqipengyuania halimionae]MXP09403.1 TIGR03013 family PEP-CTERM/XrtA system glycosyltransferase [Alteriqipengyuania halimionae]